MIEVIEEYLFKAFYQKGSVFKVSCNILYFSLQYLIIFLFLFGFGTFGQGI